MRLALTLTFTLLAITSCKPNPERVFKQMHDAACSGDV